MDANGTDSVVSVIIPTYRRPRLLERAIQSVLNQTYTHLKVCVYDNASGDDTAAVVESLAAGDDRVTYCCHPENVGAIANFNYGMERVTTPFFSLLGDDNMLLPTFVEDAVAALAREPRAMAFAGQTLIIDDDGHILSTSLDRWPLGMVPPPQGLLHIVESGLLTWESVLFRRGAMESVGLLNPSVHGAADQDFLLRLARRHALYVVKKPYALFVSHRGSWSAKRPLAEDLYGYKSILDPWLKDEGLPEDARDRIGKCWKTFVKNTISNHVFVHGIVGRDTSVVALATSLMKAEVGYAFKPLRAIAAARLVHSNRLLGGALTRGMDWYLRAKDKWISRRNAKKYDLSLKVLAQRGTGDETPKIG